MEMLNLSILPQALTICQLDKNSEIPSWLNASLFFNVSRTADELSIVCDQHLVPTGVKKIDHWRAFKVEGPLDFSLTGIVASISTALADGGISIFVVSTFDTDYILVQEKDLERAKSVLGKAFSLQA